MRIQLDLGIFELCARLDGVIHEIAEHDDKVRVRDRQLDRQNNVRLNGDPLCLCLLNAAIEEGVNDRVVALPEL